MSIKSEVLSAVEGSRFGIARLDVLGSLGLASPETLKVTLSRLNREGKIIRVKRGAYSARPIRDAFAFGQALFPGYLGFSSALRIHGLVSEIPFSVTVVTRFESRVKRFGEYEFRAVSLRDKAVGFRELDGYTVSTRAKTLFDCLYLPRYSIGEEKLAIAYRDARLSPGEWGEFVSYAKKFCSGKKLSRMLAFREKVGGV